MEITCKIEDEKLMQTELHNHQFLNKQVKLLTKTVPNTKMILLGTPEAVEFKFI